MASSLKSVNIIKMLAANEEAVGRLYEAYANKFPEHEEFWSGLAMEEADHSNWIFELLRKVNEGSARIYEDRFQAEDIQKFQNYLKEQLGKVKQEKISFVDALCTALDIEKSLVERGFLQVFDGDSEGTQSVLEYLTSATRNHIKVIQRKLEQQKEL
jgi:rubrerythrin